MSDHHQKNLMENKFYLLFLALKITFATNKLELPFDIVDN